MDRCHNQALSFNRQTLPSGTVIQQTDITIRHCHSADRHQSGIVIQQTDITIRHCHSTDKCSHQTVSFNRETLPPDCHSTDRCHHQTLSFNRQMLPSDTVIQQRQTSPSLTSDTVIQQTSPSDTVVQQTSPSDTVIQQTSPSNTVTQQTDITIRQIVASDSNLGCAVLIRHKTLSDGKVRFCSHCNCMLCPTVLQFLSVNQVLYSLTAPCSGVPKMLKLRSPPCRVSRAIKGSLWKAWSRSDHSFSCFAYCLEYIASLISAYLLLFLLCLLP